MEPRLARGEPYHDTNGDDVVEDEEDETMNGQVAYPRMVFRYIAPGPLGRVCRIEEEMHKERFCEPRRLPHTEPH